VTVEGKEDACWNRGRPNPAVLLQGFDSRRILLRERGKDVGKNLDDYRERLWEPFYSVRARPMKEPGRRT